MRIRKKITNTINNISERKLSIQFSLDGFSFCASNQKDVVYFFMVCDFNNETRSPETILKNIETVFHSEKVLQDDFESVIVIHQNSLNTFVPDIFFDKNELKNYLKFSIKTIATDLIVYDDLPKMKNVYIPYVNINNFLFQNFGEFEYKHHATVLVEKLIDKSNFPSFYIHVSANTTDLLFIENQQLTFFNSFEYTTKEDFIYYILFTLEQLELNPDTTPVTLLGEIEESSELYKILYMYVRNIAFLKIKNTFLNTTEELYNHSNILLLT